MYIKQAFMGLWVCLLIFAPLYKQPNLGGVGLDLTFNISIWFTAIWLILVALWQTKRALKLPKYFAILSIFPIYILFMNIIGTNNPSDLFLFKLLFVIAGFVFFLALFQAELLDADIDSLLFMIVIAAGIHSLISAIQIFLPEAVLNPWSSLRDNVPRGVFQQVNVNASFLATAVIISVYLMSRAWIHSANKLKKTILWTSYTLSLYIIFASGSRVGVLAIVLAMPLVVSARVDKFINNKKTITALLSLMTISLISGYAGIENTVDKSQALKEQGYQNARIAMYTIGSEVVAEDPLGHGLGLFLKAWNKQSSDFVARYPETKLPVYVTHPHNELLLWTIESGIPALIGLLAIVVAISLGLYNCGFKTGGAYAAMLLPISLHTQVELPFYISALHWFVWLFLIYLVFRKQVRDIEIDLSLSMKKLLKTAGLSSTILCSLFLINTAKAQQDIYNFVNGIKTETPPLEIALNNLYTKAHAEQLAMRSMLYDGINKKDKERVKSFERWALAYVQTKPELKIYEDLISASAFLKPQGKGCDMIIASLDIYAHNEALRKAKLERCE